MSLVGNQNEHLTEIAELRRQLLHFACAVLDHWMENDTTREVTCHFCGTSRALETGGHWKLDHAGRCVVLLALQIATKRSA